MLALVVVALLTLLAAFGFWRYYFFHRSPERSIPPGDEVLSPADGRILYLDCAELPASNLANRYQQRVSAAFAGQGSWQIAATYLSIFDVHSVRAPVSGRVRLRHLEPIGNANLSMGKGFLFAALRRPLPIGYRGYADKNELLAVEFSGPQPAIVVMMADWWIDQIHSYVQDGDEVERGQLIGKIQMGSQVDLWLPSDSQEMRAEVGARVRAGETIMASALPTRSVHDQGSADAPGAAAERSLEPSASSAHSR